MVFRNKELSDWCVHCYLGIIAYRTSQTETEICMYTHMHTRTHTPPTSMCLCLKHGLKLIMPILMAYFLSINITPFTKKPWNMAPLSSTYYFLSPLLGNNLLTIQAIFSAPAYHTFWLYWPNFDPSLTDHISCASWILHLYQREIGEEEHLSY